MAIPQTPNRNAIRCTHLVGIVCDCLYITCTLSLKIIYYIIPHTVKCSVQAATDWYSSTEQSEWGEPLPSNSVLPLVESLLFSYTPCCLLLYQKPSISPHWIVSVMFSQISKVCVFECLCVCVSVCVCACACVCVCVCVHVTVTSFAVEAVLL